MKEKIKFFKEVKMINLFKKLKDWNRGRIERNYERIISQYSPEEQELIRKGRDIRLLGSINEIEEYMEILGSNKKIVYLTGQGSLYKSAITGKPLSRILEHDYVPYSRRDLGCRNYESNVEYWLKIGKLGADALCDITSRPQNLSDHNITMFTLGIPIKIQDKN